MKKKYLVCEDCGGSNIETKVWVNANTNKFISDASDGDSSDNWCDDCEDHVAFVELDKNSIRGSF